MRYRLSRPVILMFLVFLVGFSALGLIIADLKHPEITYDSCRFVGRGAEIAPFTAQAIRLGSPSGQAQDDFGFACKKQGDIVINSPVPVPPQPQQHVSLQIRDYQYLPTRYNLSVKVINPTEAALNTKPPQKTE